MRKRNQSNNLLLHLALFLSLLITINLLSSSSTVIAAARPLAAAAVGDISEESFESESMELMGMEKCEKEEDECLERRMISEAHLDYIYTQNHGHH
ncbi:Putative phytosulfokines 6 [Linum perenne]